MAPHHTRGGDIAQHFRITTDTAQLARAESVLAEIGAQLGAEGIKLAGLPAQAGDWTGRTASPSSTPSPPQRPLAGGRRRLPG
jgi:hypothetical protein